MDRFPNSCAATMSVVIILSLYGAQAFDVKIGVFARLHGTDGSYLGLAREQQAAAAMMAVHHIGRRDSPLVLNASSAIHSGMNLSIELADSGSLANIAMATTLKWTDDGVSIIVGASRSAVSGPVSLLASVSRTPVISYGSTSSELSDKASPSDDLCPRSLHLF